MSSTLRQLNVRLPPELVELVTQVGDVAGLSLTAAVHEALDQWVEAKRGDEAWQIRRRERLTELEAL